MYNSTQQTRYLPLARTLCVTQTDFFDSPVPCTSDSDCAGGERKDGIAGGSCGCYPRADGGSYCAILFSQVVSGCQHDNDCTKFGQGFCPGSDYLFLGRFKGCFYYQDNKFTKACTPANPPKRLFARRGVELDNGQQVSRNIVMVQEDRDHVHKVVHGV